MELVKLYVDVIFMENFIINFIILLLTRKFSKEKTNNLKLIFGAFLGASYVILLFFSLPNIFYSFGFKIIISIMIIIVSFGIKRIKNFLKIISTFYIISFIMGGTAFALIYVVNFDFKQIIIWSIILTIVLIYIAWDYIIKRNIQNKLIHVLHVNIMNTNKDIKAMIDTGNSLYDPLSKIPVIIVEYDALKEILPESIKNLFSKEDYQSIFKIPNMVKDDKWMERLRIIPYNSIGNENGLLLGIKPDNITIDENGKTLKDVILGIYAKKFSENNNYEAIIGPELIA